MRQLLEEVRRHQRDHSEADRDGDNEQVEAVGSEVDVGQDAGAGGRDHAEHHEARATEHDLRNGLDQRGHLRHQAQDQHDDAAGDGHPARLDAGDADQADILRERRVGEGVEDAADQGADAIGPQAARQRLLIHLFVGHLSERQEHAERFDHHHDHDNAHGDARDQVEFRHAEMKRDDDVGPGRGRDFLEVHDAEDAGEDCAGDDAEQHRDIGDEARAPLDQPQDHQQDEQRNAESLQLSVARIGEGAGHAVDHLGQRRQAAAGPVHAHPHQRDADHHDDGAGHHRRKQRQQAADEGRGDDAEKTGNNHGAVDPEQPHIRRGGHRQHRPDGGKRHPHHHREADADAGKADALDQRGKPAGEQIGADKKSDIFGRQLQGPPDDQRHGDRAGIHHQDMLQAEGEQPWIRQKLIDRMRGLTEGRGVAAHVICPVSTAPRQYPALI